jgi:hypothetical protein
MIQEFHSIISSSVVTTTRVVPLSGGNVTTSTNVSEIRMPYSGSVKNLRVNINTAPGVGKLWYFIITKNGSDTSLEGIISGDQLECSNTTDVVTFETGDGLSLKIVPEDEPTSYGVARFTVDVETESDYMSVVSGGSTSSVSNSADSYIAPAGLHAFSATESLRSVIVPTSGVLSHLWAGTNGNTGSGNSFDVTLLKNGSPTSLTCNVTNITGALNSTGWVSVQAGDIITIKTSPVNTPTARALIFSMRFTATIPGESIVFGTTVSEGTTNNRYLAPNTAINFNATYNLRDGLGHRAILKKFYGLLSIEPGSGATRTFTLRKNETSTDLALSFGSADVTSSNTTDEVALSTGDTYSVFAVRSGTISSSNLCFGLVSYIEVLSTNWYNSSWTKRVKVTVDKDKVPSDLTDYPVYVNLANLPSAFHTNVNQTDARDIRVTTSDGITEIPREVVFYDNGTDTGELHFKGNLLSSTNTDFYIYYGNSSATEPASSSTYGSENVWNDYKMVVHFDEDPTTSNILDSTAGGHDGVPEASDLSRVTGIVGRATRHNKKIIDFGSHSDNELTNEDFTISIWAKKSESSSGWSNVAYIAKWNTGASTSTCEWIIGATVGGGDNRPNINVAIGSTQYVASSPDGFSLDTWYLITAKRTGGTLSLFVNGVEKGTNTTLSTSSINTVSGRKVKTASIDFSTTLNLKGDIDEFRLVKGSALSDNWITTEYNNQSSPNTFYAVGSEEENTSGITFISRLSLLGVG